MCVVVPATPLNVNNENANEGKKRRDYVFSAYALIAEIGRCENQIKLQTRYHYAQTAQ
jgi:hypothetical protein